MACRLRTVIVSNTAAVEACPDGKLSSPLPFGRSRDVSDLRPLVMPAVVANAPAPTMAPCAFACSQSPSTSPRRSYRNRARADLERRTQPRTHVDGLQVVHGQRVEHRGIRGVSGRQALVVDAVRTLTGRRDLEALRDPGRDGESPDTDRGIARFGRNPATVVCAARRCKHAHRIARDRRVPQAIAPVLRAAL